MTEHALILLSFGRSEFSRKSLQFRQYLWHPVSLLAYPVLTFLPSYLSQDLQTGIYVSLLNIMHRKNSVYATILLPF